MQIQIGIISTENQLNVLSINNDNLESKVVDLVGIKEEELNLLLIDESLNLESFQKTLNSENKFYPIVNMDALELSTDTINSLTGEDLIQLYLKVSSRWIMSNNINSIEQIYPTTQYFKNLWIQDRNSFFEELWFFMKSNLNTNELNIIFHDLKEPNQKQQEKGEKPSLCYSYVQGTKLPNLFEGKEKEAVLMKEYDKEFSDKLNVTEFSAEKGQLVACAKIELSPILIMAKLTEFNQLQKSILTALFNGFNANKA